MWPEDSNSGNSFIDHLYANDYNLKYEQFKTIIVMSYFNVISRINNNKYNNIHGLYGVREMGVVPRLRYII